MEHIPASVPSSHFFSAPSLLSFTIPVRTCSNRNPFISYPHSFKLPLHATTCIHFPYFIARSSRISAHFGRISTRRNFLRKKLLEDLKVRRTSVVVAPVPKFGDKFSQSKLYYDNEKCNELDDGVDTNVVETESNGVEAAEVKSDLQTPVFLTKLENWLYQCNRDLEVWGIGTGSIFTVYQGLDGNVERVVVDEDEILRRSEFEDRKEADLRILKARSLARDMERGENVIPRNSFVAKFLISGENPGSVSVFQKVILPHDFVSKVSKVGIGAFCGLIVVCLVKSLFSFRNREVNLTRMEKEMLRRKIKSRAERENMEKDGVEVIGNTPPRQLVVTEKPKLDKEELMKNICKAKGLNRKLPRPHFSSSPVSNAIDPDPKIPEIRETAKQARKVEGEAWKDREKRTLDGDSSDQIKVLDQHEKEGPSCQSNTSDEDLRKSTVGSVNGTIDLTSLNKSKADDLRFQNGAASVLNETFDEPPSATHEELNKRHKDLEECQSTMGSLKMRDSNQCCDSSPAKSCLSEKIYNGARPRVIRSVKEAREYLSLQHSRTEANQEAEVRNMQEDTTNLSLQADGMLDISESRKPDEEREISESSLLGGKSDKSHSTNDCLNTDTSDPASLPSLNGSKKEVDNITPRLSSDIEGKDNNAPIGQPVDNGDHMKKYEPELDRVFKKIADGFRENYSIAREKVNREGDLKSDFKTLELINDDGEFEWMKNDGLREIVLKVRENELAGRDPFYMMDGDDKIAFFKGLERKVEKVNQKLLKVHEWLHSNIENLDYGADGISLYDPPEKIIPRWRGPPIDKISEFIKVSKERNEQLEKEDNGLPFPTKKNEQDSLQKLQVPSSRRETPSTDSSGGSKAKTVIESSDGSVRAGKKSGKEYWQHTKKWTRGFLECYNAETDPEVKAIMKDMGKDLDRWTTEKEIEEAGDLMTNLSEGNRNFVEKKIAKLKREMELFGPQAVVSKYREYGDEKEEDYLWWLDLPFVLCIELYTNENGQQKIGLYSLEMAADLELDPKQYHVIAFEDPGDCRNHCYIIQAHMEMLGNGHAFVVAQPPKDAFRDAKANGFNVTVIRKGQLQLNIDQTLEEAEELITEVGSKIYHDKIIQERSVDMSSLMKGVFGAGTPTRRRSREELIKSPKL